jgi:hypothetical protein
VVGRCANCKAPKIVGKGTQAVAYVQQRRYDPNYERQKQNAGGNPGNKWKGYMPQE